MSHTCSSCGYKASVVTKGDAEGTMVLQCQRDSCGREEPIEEHEAIETVHLYKSRSPHFPKSKNENCYLILDVTNDDEDGQPLGVVPLDIEMARKVAKILAPNATITE